MNILSTINDFHASANPANLFASVQASYIQNDSPKAKSLETLINDAEEHHLFWVARRDKVIQEIELNLEKNTLEENKIIIPQMIDYFNDLITEDCGIAEVVKQHFKHSVKRAKAISKPEAKHLAAFGKRFFNLSTRQIDAFIYVVDCLRALRHHYDDSPSAKDTEEMLPVDAATADKDLHQWLMSD